MQKSRRGETYSHPSVINPIFTKIENMKKDVCPHKGCGSENFVTRNGGELELQFFYCNVCHQTFEKPKEIEVPAGKAENLVSPSEDDGTGYAKL